MTTSFDTQSALQSMGVVESTLTSKEKDFLDENGYLLFTGILDPAQIEALRTRLDELLVIEKDTAGKEVHQEAGTARLANLVDKGAAFRICYTHPRVLAAVAHVLNNDMKLSSLNSRAALPGQGMQPLHVDWRHGGVEPGNYQVCNTMWLLDDFTTENGATRYVPKSHRLGKIPPEVMKDPSAPHPDQELLIAPAGSVLVFNSHTWHGGTQNRTDKPRRAIHAYWGRRQAQQQTNQRANLSPEVKASFSAPVKYLLDIED